MTDREVMQQVLKAWDDPRGMKDLCVAMDALRTTPPAAQRKPLTDEEIGKAWSVADGEHNASASVKRRITGAIEAAHGIKD